MYYRQIRDFNWVASVMAVGQCYEAGYSLTEIAESAKRSKSTIRRWVRLTKQIGTIHERNPKLTLKRA